MNITQDPKYKIFIRRKGQVKKSSIDKYTQDLTYYTISTNQSLTDLIDEARLEQKTIEDDEERQVYNHLEEFKEYLENDREMSDYTIMNCIKTVKTFYNRFKIDTSEFEFTAYPETFYVNVDDLPGQVDIQLILTDANKKYKALITFLASTGMGLLFITNNNTLYQGNENSSTYSLFICSYRLRYASILCSINNSIASCHAVLTGSLLYFIRAISLNISSRSTNTVAAVLVVGFDTLCEFFSGIVNTISTSVSFYLNMYSHNIYIYLFSVLFVQLSQYLYSRKSYLILCTISTTCTQLCHFDFEETIFFKSPPFPLTAK